MRPQSRLVAAIPRLCRMLPTGARSYIPVPRLEMAVVTVKNAAATVEMAGATVGHCEISIFLTDTIIISQI